MQVHFIAIGGSAMHSLALALQRKGYTVTGSDDEILEPSRSRLQLCCQNAGDGFQKKYTRTSMLLFWVCTPVKIILNYVVRGNWH